MSFLVKQLMKSAVGQAATGREPDPFSVTPSAPSGPSHAAVVRTLMLRIETCQVAQDRREALRELSNVSDLGVYLTVEHSRSLLQIAKDAVGVDHEISSGVLDILSAATDPATTSVDHSERVLGAVVDVPFFLGYFDDASFWSKYHAVQMIQRLEQAHTATVHQQLLATHGLHAIIDVLNDDSNGGALRNEGLILLAALTATNQELQTIIAFENGFDSLFQIIQEESGLAGGVVVTDCLSTIMNMLRGNNATQKFFREMGCARHLVPILNAISPSAAEVQGLAKPVAGEAPAWVSEFSQSISADASVTLHRCFAILQCLLQGSDMNGEGPATRTALVHSGLIPALAAVAFAPAERVDPAIRAEALRTTVLMLQKVRASCDAFAQCRVSQRYDTTNKRAWFVGSVVWATLRMMLSTADEATQVACSSILGALVDASGSSVAVASALMKNLSKPSTTSVPLPVHDGSHCGPLVAAALFSHLATPSSTATYYVAILLQQSLMVPQVSEQLLHVPWEGTAKTFFLAYATHVVRVIQAKQADACTISALIRPLLVWLMFTSKAAVMLLGSDGATFQFFLDWFSQHRDSVHTRFLSLIASCAIALAAPVTVAAASGAIAPSRSMQQLSEAAHVDRAALFQQISERTIAGKKLRDLAEDIEQSQDWTGAPSSAVTSPKPCLYDNAFKALIGDIIKQTNHILQPTVSAVAPSTDVQQVSPERQEHMPATTAVKVPSPAAAASPRAVSPVVVIPSAQLPPVAYEHSRVDVTTEEVKEAQQRRSAEVEEKMAAQAAAFHELQSTMQQKKNSGRLSKGCLTCGRYPNSSTSSPGH
ncbi:Hypothetical protein, putative [Bodo saltans]|uniref:Uncharacterized protein n=1 Tax=Bodo saltans TaxID=75058 RepID=A0A0S4KL82_BODSA|nr:Hypothetical protein, putative [Bodo saltans]|eukprot:CUI15154.1 Hypothetical protein, putative [Bodo saltans]